MLCFNTDRMLAKTEMQIINGMLVNGNVQSGPVDILHLRKSTGLESAFVFYEKMGNNAQICHISITHKRDRFEVSYGTEEHFRRQGYMKEALSQLVSWIFSNTCETEIWGLPNGEESEHILQTCGFLYYAPFEKDASMKWYRIEKPFMED